MRRGGGLGGVGGAVHDIGEGGFGLGGGERGAVEELEEEFFHEWDCSGAKNKRVSESVSHAR